MSESGHWYSMLWKIYAHFSRASTLSALLPCNSNVRTPDSVEIIPILDQFDLHRSIIGLFIRLFNKFKLDIFSLLFMVLTETVRLQIYKKNVRLKRCLDQADVVLLCDPSLAFLLLVCFDKELAKKIIFYYPTPPESFTFKFRRRTSNWLIKFYLYILRFKSKTVTFAFDDVQIIKSLKERSNVIQFPYTLGLDSLKSTQKKSTSELLLPGSYNSGKNYDQVIRSIGKIGKEGCVGRGLCVLCRYSHTDIPSLPTWMWEKVIITMPYLSFREYLDAISRAALVVLAYDPKVYAVDGASSGILRECLYLGTPVLVLENTWNSAFLKSLKTECSDFIIRDESQLVERILSIIDSREYYQEKFTLLQKQYIHMEAALKSSLSQMILPGDLTNRG